MLSPTPALPTPALPGQPLGQQLDTQALAHADPAALLRGAGAAVAIAACVYCVAGCAYCFISSLLSL
jgi:hypothetical protein